MNNIRFASDELESRIRGIVEEFQKIYPDLEIHTIRIDGRFSYVTKKLEYGIYADVRDKGQIFLGMCN